MRPRRSALSHWAHDTDFPTGQAVEFLRYTIRAHPGEVVLLAIGPLTNIAALFAADAEIPALLKGIGANVWGFYHSVSGCGATGMECDVGSHRDRHCLPPASSGASVDWVGRDHSGDDCRSHKLENGFKRLFCVPCWTLRKSGSGR